MTALFRRVAVLGTGLIGGSFGLAFHRAFPLARRIGWDKPDVLDRARERGAIDEASTDLASACGQADLVYVALPVSQTIRLLPVIAAAVPSGALVTDAASTKTAVCNAAKQAFRFPEHFVGGHPMAGKERGGIENADADLFRGMPYVLIGSPGDPRRMLEQVRSLVSVIEAIGARLVWLEAEEHDRLAAFLSHLPQLAAIALAETVLDGPGEAAAVLAGPGLRDTLRLAGSPYDAWVDICRTSPYLGQALEGLSQAIDRLRARSQTGELREDFERANRLYKILRGLE